MIIQEEQWSGIPLLHVFTEEMTSESPVVLFLHGHLSAKEHNLHYAYQLVKEGVRVLLPDAVYHGDRSKQLSEVELTIKFWDIVLQSLKEIDTIVKIGLEKNLFNKTKIAIAGSSMGAIVTSAALTKYDWIKTAAICMGVTSLSNLATHHFKLFESKNGNISISDEQKQQMLNYLKQFDLENKSQILYEKPVVFWHGEKDEIVPIKYSLDFYESDLHNSKAEFIKEKNAAHKMSRKGLLAVTSFLAQHLSK